MSVSLCELGLLHMGGAVFNSVLFSLWKGKEGFFGVLCHIYLIS